MTRYTDSAFTITATNAHFSTAREIHITFRQAYSTLDITNVSVLGDTELIVTLTQAQTAQLREGTAELQINYIGSDGQRRASNVATVDVSKNLLQRVIANE